MVMMIVIVGTLDFWIIFLISKKINTWKIFSLFYQVPAFRLISLLLTINIELNSKKRNRDSTIVNICIGSPLQQLLVHPKHWSLGLNRGV